MAMYTTVKGYINKVEVKSYVSGVEADSSTNKASGKMAVVSIAMASKRKDEKGAYTIKENTFFIRAVTFSKSLIEKLDGQEKLFCELSLKAESVKKDENYFDNRYLLGFTDLTLLKAPEEATSTDTTDITSTEITSTDTFEITSRDTLSEEEKEKILSEYLAGNKK